MNHVISHQPSLGLVGRGGGGGRWRPFALDDIFLFYSTGFSETKLSFMSLSLYQIKLTASIKVFVRYPVLLKISAGNEVLTYLSFSAIQYTVRYSMLFSSLPMHWGFSVADCVRFASVADYIEYCAYFYFLQQLGFCLPIRVYPSPPCQLPCGRKPECPEKTHEFQQSVD